MDSRAGLRGERGGRLDQGRSHCPRSARPRGSIRAGHAARMWATLATLPGRYWTGQSVLSGLRKLSASTLDSAPCSLASGWALSKLSRAPLALAVPSRSPRALPANWATLREHAKALDLFSSLLPLSKASTPPSWLLCSP